MKRIPVLLISVLALLLAHIPAAAVRVSDGAILTQFTSGDVTEASDHLPLYIEVIL